MEQPLISIILPIYNVEEKYLRKCIESLQVQTLKAIEIICVLDCPTDNSEEIVRGYAKEDDRIVVIKNESNQHIGLSRNIGMQVAKGEYIGFSDDDDYCDAEMYEELYKVAKKNHSPFVCSGHDTHVEKDGTMIRDLDEKLSDIDYCIKRILGYTSHNSAALVWDCLYEHSYIQAHNIQFLDTKVYSGEDALFNAEIVFTSKTEGKEIGFVAKSYYHHIIHGQNTGASKSYLLKTPKYRDLVTGMATKHHFEDAVLHEANMGNIAILYRVFRVMLITREIGESWNVLKNLKQYTNICPLLKKDFRLWNSELTIPKNVFNWVCRLRLVF